MQGKHSAGRGLFPLLVPHRPHSRDALSLQTPPTTGSGVGNTPQRGQLEALRGEKLSGRRCERCPRGAGGPGAARVPLPVPGLPVPRKFKCRSSQAPGPMPLAGGGSAAPAEGPRGPPRLAEGGSSSPHTAPGPSGTHPGLPEPWGPAVPPSSATGRSLRPGGDNGHDDFTLQQCEQQRGTPPTSPRPPGRSRALSPRARAPAQRRLRLGGSAPPLTRRHAQGGGRRRRPEPGDAATAGPLGAPRPAADPPPVPVSRREEAALLRPPEPGAAQEAPPLNHSHCRLRILWNWS
ncbi:translation initiation factor IF-2-like [Pyrgilauda ruficollis]|uniref:translation initiation factor IF-2-like n=1 Tax=Pyrgilauda ruficollis TaxID=221976 RepID=UPI001B85D966|nr:translation initiation factor IF-2-like [Pyrgilauda ruficollis]